MSRVVLVTMRIYESTKLRIVSTCRSSIGSNEFDGSTPDSCFFQNGIIFKKLVEIDNSQKKKTNLKHSLSIFNTKRMSILVVNTNILL